MSKSSGPYPREQNRRHYIAPVDHDRQPIMGIESLVTSSANGSESTKTPGPQHPQYRGAENTTEPVTRESQARAERGSTDPEGTPAQRGGPATEPSTEKQKTGCTGGQTPGRHEKHKIQRRPAAGQPSDGRPRQGGTTTATPSPSRTRKGCPSSDKPSHDWPSSAKSASNDQKRALALAAATGAKGGGGAGAGCAPPAEKRTSRPQV